MQAYNLILARLWPVSVIQRQPYRFASLFGVCVGLVSSASAIVAATLLIGMFQGEELGSSAGAFLSSFGPWSLFLMGVVFIPFWETFTGQLLPLEIGRAIGFNDAACAALGATIFGAGHYLNGGFAHGLCSALVGGILSTGYMTMRPWGYLPAFWTSYVAHAVNNFLALFLIPLAFPDAG